MKNKIRVGILSQSDFLYSWQDSILRDIRNCEYASLVLHLSIGNFTPRKPPPAWRLYNGLDRVLFRPSPNALAPINNNSFCKEVLTFSESEAVGKVNLNDYEIDVILNFTESEPNQALVSSCRYGVWHVVFSDSENPKSGPTGAWELIQGKPEITVTLCSLTVGMARSKILDQTSVCTDWISYSRNANMAYWQAVPLIPRNLKRLYENRDLGCLKNNPRNGTVANNPVPSTSQYPSTYVLIKHSLKTVLKKIGQLVENQFYFNQWILLFNNTSTGSKFDLSRYKRILPPKDRFWADPFLIKRNEKYYLFIEELIYKNKLGHLAVMEMDEDGNYSTPLTILKKDYHLSYPFLFEDKDNLYMIPETGSNRDIQLYKCTDFPYEWQLEKVLMRNIIAVDTTIYKKDGTYWMFTNLKERKGMSNNVELFLFSSKDLVTDQWKPHPLNPVVTDVKKSRPAGSIFCTGDEVIRPSQNCSHHYGYGINFNMITRLDNSGFEEEIDFSIEPEWAKDVLCTHTFNSCDKISISDAQIRRRRF